MFLLNSLKRKFNIPFLTMLNIPFLPMLITVLIMGCCSLGALYAIGIMIGAQSVMGISLDPMVDFIGVGFLQGCALLAVSITTYYVWVEIGLEYWLNHIKSAVNQ